MSKITTKTDVRLSYASLITPRAQNDESPDDLRYGASVLIPKSDKKTVDEIKAAIKEALAEGVAKKWGGKVPKNLKNPLRDGDEEKEDDEAYSGHYFINGKGPRAGREPAILLDSKGEETSSESVIYSGVMARVSLQFYPYDVSGNKGVACGITAVQSTGEGEPLGNTTTASSARDEFGISTPAGDAAKDFKPASTSKADEAEEGNDDDDDPWGK